MKLTLINQSQPNKRYIILDTTPEFNIPNLNLTENQSFVLGDNYSNNLHICTETEFNEYFKDNHEVYDCVILVDSFKNKIKKNILTLKKDINKIEIEITKTSGYILMNNIARLYIRFIKFSKYSKCFNKRIL